MFKDRRKDRSDEKWGRRRKQPLNNLKQKKICWNVNYEAEEAADLL